MADCEPIDTDVALRVTFTEGDRGTTIHLAGRLLAGEADWSRAVLDEVVDRSAGAITVDCGRLVYADSGGLATLFGSHRRARNRGLPWLLSGIQGQPRECLRLSGFDALLPVAS